MVDKRSLMGQDQQMKKILVTKEKENGACDRICRQEDLYDELSHYVFWKKET